MTETGSPPFRLTTLAEVETCLIAMGHLRCEMDGLSELAHGLQCADVLKAMAPDDPELQIAGLLHDVAAAHSQECDHGRVGASAVGALLGERVAELIRLHVDAKRYLVTIDPVYRAKLSPVSRLTLERQGGLMSGWELALFDANPLRDDAIRLRQADDFAKTPGKATSSIAAFRPVLRQVSRSAARACGAQSTTSAALSKGGPQTR
jgi:predicted HD phosphohydrolase